MDVVMRRLRDRDEVHGAMAVVHRQFPDLAYDEVRLAAPLETFERDRALMLCLEVDGEMRGAIIAFGATPVTVRALGIDSGLRGAGFGRRLLEAVEVEAMLRGAHAIVLGADDAARGFYECMGFRGKHTITRCE
jgi:GNAT superfamily N-acetyltransferase